MTDENKVPSIKQLENRLSLLKSNFSDDMFQKIIVDEKIQAETRSFINDLIKKLDSIDKNKISFKIRSLIETIKIKKNESKVKTNNPRLENNFLELYCLETYGDVYSMPPYSPKYPPLKKLNFAWFTEGPCRQPKKHEEDFFEFSKHMLEEFKKHLDH